MKLKLKNFRCYLDKEFDFGENGITLISGVSGVGKTTLILAINFVLFGSGTKLVTYGKTSCSVELEFDNMKIVRTKRPNRLVVNDVYEDDAGQEIINNIFGVTFETTGYISQNGMNSFILMSPIEKLGFLEKFAFKDLDLDSIKSRCKAHISKCNDELISVNSQLDLMRGILSGEKKPCKMLFPVKCKKDQQELVIKNENVGLRNSDILIKKGVKNLKCVENELSELKVFLANTGNKNENIDNIDKKISILDDELESLGFDELFDINWYRNELDNIVKYKELNELEKSYKENLLKMEKIREEEVENYKRKIEKYEKEVWIEYSFDDVVSNLKDYKELLVKMRELCKYRKEIEKYNNICEEDYENGNKKLDNLCKDLENWEIIYKKLKSQEDVYKCPKCCGSLRFVNDKLVELSEEIINEYNILDVKVKIDKIKKEISILDKDVRNIEYGIKMKDNISKSIEDILSNYEEMDVEEIESSIIELEKYKKENEIKYNELVEVKNKLENSIFSVSYNSFNKLVLRDEKKIKELSKICGNRICEFDEEKVRNIINKYEFDKNRFDRIKKDREMLVKELNKIKDIIVKLELNYIEKYIKIRDIIEIESDINKYTEEIEKNEDKKKRHENNLFKINEWKNNEEKVKKYDEMENKVKDLEIVEQEVRYKYAAATLLKEKILEAESISLLNIIDSINTHAQIYLESFFVENPISIRLLPFKETKKSTKPQINMEIEYKSMECDFNSLSGGEQARVILAFTLSLAEIFNTPLMLLDECVANLDQETTGIVFDSIREHYKGKLSLVIAHQVVMGHFDKIIKIE
jgi:DNA repair exonuclease SbcCD ATPase subunit